MSAPSHRSPEKGTERTQRVHRFGGRAVERELVHLRGRGRLGCQLPTDFTQALHGDVLLSDGIVIQTLMVRHLGFVALLARLVIEWCLSTLWILAVSATAARWSLRQRHRIHLSRIARLLSFFRRILSARTTRRVWSRRHAHCPGLSLLLSGAPAGATGICTGVTVVAGAFGVTGLTGADCVVGC